MISNTTDRNGNIRRRVYCKGKNKLVFGHFEFEVSVRCPVRDEG